MLIPRLADAGDPALDSFFAHPSLVMHNLNAAFMLVEAAATGGALSVWHAPLPVLWALLYAAFANVLEARRGFFIYPFLATGTRGAVPAHCALLVALCAALAAVLGLQVRLRAHGDTHFRIRARAYPGGRARARAAGRAAARIIRGRRRRRGRALEVPAPRGVRERAGGGRGVVAGLSVSDCLTARPSDCRATATRYRFILFIRSGAGCNCFVARLLLGLPACICNRMLSNARKHTQVRTALC